MKAVLPDRFWSKVDKSALGGCWSWIGCKARGGYGMFRLGKMVLAHRIAYEAYIGDIPQGLEIDHLCRNRSCVNPEHLELVTHQENTLRGDTLTAANARKTHCPRGHLYDAIDIRGRRWCRMCHDDQVHAYRLRRRYA